MCYLPTAISQITTGTTWATGPCFGIVLEFLGPDEIEAQYRIEEIMEDYTGTLHSPPPFRAPWEILSGQTSLKAFTPLYHRCGEPWRRYTP